MKILLLGLLAIVGCVKPVFSQHRVRATFELIEMTNGTNTYEVLVSKPIENPKKTDFLVAFKSTDGVDVMYLFYKKGGEGPRVVFNKNNTEVPINNATFLALLVHHACEKYQIPCKGPLVVIGSNNLPSLEKVLGNFFSTE